MKIFCFVGDILSKFLRVATPAFCERGLFLERKMSVKLYDSVRYATHKKN